MKVWIVCFNPFYEDENIEIKGVFELESKAYEFAKSLPKCSEGGYYCIEDFKVK